MRHRPEPEIVTKTNAPPAGQTPLVLEVTDNPDGGVKRGAAPRISTKLRKAVELRVRTGMTIKEACEAAGLSEAGWHAAAKRPHVQALIEQEKLKLIRDVEAVKGIYKAQAYQVAAELMHTAKSEAVRMRAVEFFAGGGASGPIVSVQNSVTVQAGAYEYAPPGARIVDITPEATDGSSVGQDDASD